MGIQTVMLAETTTERTAMPPSSMTRVARKRRWTR
jgi:hypothetical protein